MYAQTTRPRHIEPEHLSPNLVPVWEDGCAQTIPHTDSYPPVLGFNMPGTCSTVRLGYYLYLPQG